MGSRSGGGSSAPGCRPGRVGQVHSGSLQADPICNWLESASLEGMLEERHRVGERKRGGQCSETERRKGHGRGGRVHTRSRHIGQCRDTPGALFSTSHLLTYLPPPFAYPDQRTYRPGHGFPSRSRRRIRSALPGVGPCSVRPWIKPRSDGEMCVRARPCSSRETRNSGTR